MRSNKGITMIMMVITIIMMVLIAGFSIYNSRNTIVEIKLSKTYEEIKEVKNAVANLNILVEDLSEYLGTTPFDNLNAYNQLIKYHDDTQENRYYYLEFVPTNKALEDTLELRNIENNYIVNVINSENIEIFLINGVKINDDTYYTDEEILEKYNDIFAGR